jgi:hypothetical protein
MNVVEGFKLKHRIGLILICLMTFGCTPIKVVREFRKPDQPLSFDLTKKMVKVHMKDGGLYVLTSLNPQNNIDTIGGIGSYYNRNRAHSESEGIKKDEKSGLEFKIPLSKVAIIETNNLKGVTGHAVALAVVGIPTAVITGICLADPKACFGSCPTFYGWNGKDTCLMAEGFSSSILPSFEKEDIDMLYHKKVTGKDFHLRLTNEALETHVIRSADLLVFPKNYNERIFASPEGKFFRTSEILEPTVCSASEGDILNAVRQMDNVERYCQTDDKNLIQREMIEMRFDSVPAGEVGLIIGCRQTFLTTFLFYQSLAYLGNSAGYFASRIESGDKSLENRVNRVWDLLGGIEILVESSNGKWEKAGQIDEMGPISTDVHILSLPRKETGKLNVKLRLTKGLWRINYLALGKISDCGQPERIHPLKVTALNKSEIDSDSQLQDPLNPLVTLPGNVFDLQYALPCDNEDYEVFLASKGYYLEWMRETWAKEENFKNAAMLFGFPKKYMKMSAPDFKKIEPSIESQFWNSRYVKKN